MLILFSPQIPIIIQSMLVDSILQEVYRIELPGPPNIGEGKPENQNHAIIFTRGEALQTIDMNQVCGIKRTFTIKNKLCFSHCMYLQDNYLEEAYKMRNVLQEFMEDRGNRTPTIVGLREHVFTGRSVMNSICMLDATDLWL